MKKNKTDQRGPTDISLIASVIAMNAKPGPDFSSSKETSETIYSVKIGKELSFVIRRLQRRK